MQIQSQFGQGLFFTKLICSAKELIDNPYWKCAPPFLLKDESLWPPPFKALTAKEAEEQILLDEKEIAPQKLSAALNRRFRSHLQLRELGDKTSKWGPLLRTTAIIFRFLLKCIPSKW